MRLFGRASGTTGNRTSELIEKFNKIDIDCCLISRSSWADESVFWVIRRQFIFKILPTYPEQKTNLLTSESGRFQKLTWHEIEDIPQLGWKSSLNHLENGPETSELAKVLIKELGETKYLSQCPTLIKVIRIEPEDVEGNRSHVFLIVNTVTSLSWSLEWTFCLFMANVLRQMLGHNTGENPLNSWMQHRRH